jgi:hypothetical protein
MATVHIDAHAVTVTLNRFERLCCGGRTRLVVPRSEIASCVAVEHPTRAAVTGVGRVGLGVTGVIKIGRWGLGSATRRWVSARRWVPALHLVVRDGFEGQLGYHELVISTPDAAELAGELAPVGVG